MVSVCRFVLLPLLIVVSVRASPVASCAQEPVLRWGGDQEGGGPYIYPRDDDPTRLVGFEVELAGALARQLGVREQFVQCGWAQILADLDRGDIDLALNGYEFTPERAQHYQASLPYYIYELGLCVRRDERALTSWDALRKLSADGRKWRVGVLGASAADRYVSNEFSKTCEVLHYDGSTEALRLVDSGQLDATVQDLPVLLFYVNQLQRYPRLIITGQPAQPGYYVMYVRRNDKSRVDTVNAALQTLYSSGELRAIYDRYGLWNKTQETLPVVWDDWNKRPAVQATSRWQELRLQVPLLLHAATVTVQLAALSMPLAVGIGLLVALIRSWRTAALGGSGTAEGFNRLLHPLCTFYVEIIRGTPLAFQLFVVFFVLPEFHVSLSAFWAGVLALAVNYSAYEAEIFRLGLQAIPRGQMEAALALGMSRRLAVRRIILPQAVRIVIPATANDFIALFKDTAVCSVIAVEELSKRYQIGANSTGLYLEMAALASVLYLLMSYPLSRLAGWLERQFASS